MKWSPEVEGRRQQEKQAYSWLNLEFQPPELEKINLHCSDHSIITIYVYIKEYGDCL